MKMTAISQGGLEKATVMAGLWTVMQLSGGDTSVSMDGKELKPESGPWRQQMDQKVLFFGVCWRFSTELKRDEFPMAGTSLLAYGGAISVHCCPTASTLFLSLPATPRKTPVHSSLGFPGGASSKDPTYQCRRHEGCGFDPWVWKIPAEGTHSSTLAWEVPWREDPGGLQSTGWQRVALD